MPDPYLVLALVVPGAVVFGLGMAALRLAIKRQYDESPQELSMVEAFRIDRTIERLAREGEGQ